MKLLTYIKFKICRFPIFVCHEGERLYLTPGSTEKWKKVYPVTVPMYEFHTNQVIVNLGGMIKALRKKESEYTQDDYVYLVWQQGRYWVEDGHHRILAAYLRGEKTIEARVYDTMF